MDAHEPDPSQVPEGARDGLVSYAVFRLARVHRGRAGAMLRSMGLHPGQELILMQLFDRDGQTQSELLESVGLDHSTLSKALGRMQQAGLLERCPSPHDRRASVVSLTDRGRAMRESIERMWRALERDSTHGVTADEAAAFIAIARKIERSLADTRP